MPWLAPKTRRMIMDDTITVTQRWVCQVCDFVYDEAVGIPGEGIAPGTRFEAIPEDWYCPDCGVGKADFRHTY